MKILICHNHYQEYGGEDAVVAAEKELLESHGHKVILYERHNDEIKDYSFLKKLRLFYSTTWARDSYKQIKNIIRNKKPDIAHFHNTLPLISPSAYWACADEGLPVVQTLHNFRLLCPGALFLRNDQICEECLAGNFKPALRHRCYRGRYLETRAVVRMLEYHRKIGTYDDKIAKYITLTGFCRNKFIEAGFPAEKIVVKPNFISNPPEPKPGGDYALFASRLSHEKGINILIEAWKGINFPLKICGAGPERPQVERNASSHVEILGQLRPNEIADLLSKARFVIIPSICYEGFPRVVVEAFAAGKATLVSRIGSVAEIVEDGVAGFQFESGNTGDLREKALRLSNDKSLADKFGRNARNIFEEKYTSDKNHRMLMEIYVDAINTASV
jgi:glycosyltransferase involved in cell wall biosynthesis